MNANAPPAVKQSDVYATQYIRHWMSTPAITISLDTQVSEALALMHQQSIRRLPVVKPSGELCGIVTDGDIRGASALRTIGLDLREIASALQRTTVYGIMTDDPISVSPSATLREAALLMLDNKIGGLPVVDADNNVIGVLTESDLFEALVCYLDLIGNQP